MNVVRRVARGIGQLFRVVGREIAAAIRFGAIPASVAPRGRSANVNSAGVVAGAGRLGTDELEFEQGDRD
jgi:hypothetical protein